MFCTLTKKQHGQRKLKWIGSEDNKYQAKAGLTIKCIRALGKIRQFNNNNLSYQYKSLIQTRQNALVGSTKIKGVSKRTKNEFILRKRGLQNIKLI